MSAADGYWLPHSQDRSRGAWSLFEARSGTKRHAEALVLVPWRSLDLLGSAARFGVGRQEARRSLAARRARCPLSRDDRAQLPCPQPCRGPLALTPAPEQRCGEPRSDKYVRT